MDRSFCIVIHLISGFLLALGGVALQRKSPVGGLRVQVMNQNEIGGAAGGGGKKVGLGGGAVGAVLHQMPHGSSQDMYCPVTSYLGKLLILLVCPNGRFGTQIQKHVKELVGHEMSPLLYPILFDQIKSFVDKFFDVYGQVIVNDKNTQFIEHIIFIMTKVLESKPENQPPENLGQTSIETMMLTIVR